MTLAKVEIMKKTWQRTKQIHIPRKISISPSKLEKRRLRLSVRELEDYLNPLFIFQKSQNKLLLRHITIWITVGYVYGSLWDLFFASTKTVYILTVNYC